MPDVPRQDFIELLGGRSAIEQVLEAMPEWVAIVDRDHRVHLLSAPNRRDATDSEAHLGKADDFILEDQRAAYLADLDAAFATGEPALMEYDARTPEGIELRLASTVTPIRGEDGDVAFLLFLSRDVTEERARQAELEAALERERAALASVRELEERKAEFMARIMHDLRTPITVIQGFTDTLEQRWNEIDDTDRLRFIGLASAATRRLMRLVEDVMLVSRLESDELPLHRAPFDIVPLLHSVAVDLVHGTDRAPVDVAAPAEPVLVDGDEVRVRQVVVNLLANALRFSPADEAVVITVEPGTDEHAVSVRDHGPGIAAKDQCRLFQRFTQLHDDQSGHGGSGLGLYICRQIVLLHGGTIGVDSTPCEGATFRFTLPAAR